MQNELRALALENWDVVHFDTIGLAQYRHLFGNVAATLGHHNIESHMMRRRSAQESNPLLRAYFELEALRLEAYERATAAQFDCHITCSTLDSERLRRVSSNASVTDIPNGVDCEYFKRSASTLNPKGNSGAPQIDLLFVGTMDWYPNAAAMEFFVEDVWPLLVQRRPGIRMGIVGRNPSARLKQAASASGGISLYGYVDDVRPFMESASVFVCPIKDGGGTKLKILDAMAMESCIVADPISCEGIDVQDGVHVRLASEPTEYVAAIDSILGSRDLQSRMGLAARTLVQNRYSYESLGRRLSDLWVEIVVGKRPRR